MGHPCQEVPLWKDTLRWIKAEPIVVLFLWSRAAAVRQTHPFAAVAQGLGEAAAGVARAQHQPLQGLAITWVDIPMGMQYICISP
jgi:hypothetical protein